MSKFDDTFEKEFEQSIQGRGEIPEKVERKATLVGVAAAGTAAAGTGAAIMSLGAASTGTAISTLGGAAATNATLAWLGGGSLAAGGAGMAGGLLVLGTGGVAAAAVAGYGAYKYMTREKPSAPSGPPLQPSPFAGERVMCAGCGLWTYGPFDPATPRRCRGCGKALAS